MSLVETKVRRCLVTPQLERMRCEPPVRLKPAGPSKLWELRYRSQAPLGWWTGCPSGREETSGEELRGLSMDGHLKLQLR